MVRSLLFRLFGSPEAVDGEETEASEADPGAPDADAGDAEAEPTDGGTEDPEEGESADGDEEGSGSIWDLIPSWQYDGRHVESGGMSRDEQERALRDVQRQAEEIERSEEETEPHPDT